MRPFRVVLIFAVFTCLGFGSSQSDFDPDQNLWTMSNGSIRAVFQLTPEGYFVARQLSDIGSGDQWNALANLATSPIRLQIDDDVFDAQTQFTLVAQRVEA